MRQRCAVYGCVVMLLAVLTTSAWASTELPSIFDARVVGLGGAGSAFVDNSTAAFLNPAALENIDRLSVTLGLSPLIIGAEAPINEPNVGKESSAPVSPLFFGGVAYRLPVLQDRIVTGLAVFPTAGFGGKYDDVANVMGVPLGTTKDIENGLWMIETNIPVSMRIMDGLSIAMGWRLTYVMQSMKSPVLMPTNDVAMIDQQMTGLHAVGLSAGIFYRPIEQLQLGISYRSEIDIDMDGTAKFTDLSETVEMGKYDSISSFRLPDSFRLGVALWLLEGKLMIAMDLKYLAFSETNRFMIDTIQFPTGDAERKMDLAWKDVFAGHLGVEYYVHPMVPIRLGYSLSPSATPKDRTAFFTTQPGLLHGVHGGVGLEWEHWCVDLGGYYSFNTDGQVTNSTNGLPGEYKTGSFLFALSGSFHY